jgi:hypothetical protein
MTTKISIARDFSTVPAGRFFADGDASGQAFREKILLPALQQSSEVEVDLDGTEGYGSSFLEEAFGGLIRIHHLTLSQIRERLMLKAEEDPSLLVEVNEYLEDAEQRAKRGA